MITMSGINVLSQSLELKTCISMKDDKINIFEMIAVKKQSDENVHMMKILEKKR